MFCREVCKLCNEVCMSKHLIARYSFGMPFEVKSLREESIVLMVRAHRRFGIYGNIHGSKLISSRMLKTSEFTLMRNT